MPTAIAIAAHPDDIEFLMAGTLIRLGEAGWSLHYWTLANGCCGSTEQDAAETAAIRRNESMSAASLVDAKFHESICDDLGIFYDRTTLAKVASVIREVRPDIVLTHAPQDYMEDHANTCRLAVTAAFARGMPNFPVDPPRAAHSTPVRIYHAQPYSHYEPLGELVTPHFYVDTTGVLEKKVEMLAQHRSQKRWLDESQGHDSYLQTLRDLDAMAGRLSQRFEYAEGWRRHLHLGFCGPDDDPLAASLKPYIAE